MSAILNVSDSLLVDRARDVVNNHTMADVSKDDPNGDAEYTDHVRQYIVSVFQRLRVTLLVLDTLLEAYHASK